MKIINQTRSIKVIFIISIFFILSNCSSQFKRLQLSEQPWTLSALVVSEETGKPMANIAINFSRFQPAAAWCVMPFYCRGAIQN